MLTAKELTEIEKAYHNDEPRYRRLSEYVRERCKSFQQRNPKVARIILSREPLIKTLESITRKIEDRRLDKSSQESKYKYADLNDIVAFSILCPFESDIAEVSAFLRGAFEVAEESDKAAERNHDSGHRGYHYTVFVRAEDLLAYPDLEGVKCEIQVKTILSEAFDAKSHDLAYKPGRFEVGRELKKQFALLSGGLRAIDGQSEFLKDLIVREQKEMDLRRTALLGGYLSQPDTMEAGKQIGIDLSTTPRPDIILVLTALRRVKLKGPIGPAICRFAALCALQLCNEAVKILALQLCDKLVEADPDSLGSLLLRGYVYWVLGEYAEAIEANRSVVRSARADKESQEWVKRAKNNFIYFICDWKLSKKGGEDRQLEEEARGYIQEMLSRGKPRQHEADTIGLFKILFGDFDEIEKGRELLKASKRTRRKELDAQNYEQFYRLHDYVALSRLAKLAKQIFDQPV
jgi:ppGpp synthetase/RelA/SpoT-type nucleotidyltranferase